MTTRFAKSLKMLRAERGITTIEEVNETFSHKFSIKSLDNFFNLGMPVT